MLRATVATMRPIFRRIRRRRLAIFVLLITAIALLVAGALAFRDQGLSAADTMVCTRFRIPSQSCERAISAGYYCPSWDAKPGEIVPYICYGIRPSGIKAL